MFARFFKKNLLIRAVFFILSVSFILTGGLVVAHGSRVPDQDALRARSARALPELQRSLAIGFRYEGNPERRAEQVRALLEEVNRELADPGTGNLPRIAIISDYHGDVARFGQLLSDVLNELCGFKGQLDPTLSVEAQLNKQGLSLKTMNGAIYLNGDLLDRGPYGIQCFFLAKELLETAPDRVFYVSGNHDFWAFGNLLGMHLPWYQGFNFYGDRQAEALIVQQRQANPERFDSFAGFMWWAGRLAEYNDDQERFQKSVLEGQAAAIRKRFIEEYERYKGAWSDEQKDAMENFIGYFIRIDVPDPFVGLNGAGKTSSLWWKRLYEQLRSGYEARENGGAGSEELAVWKEAVGRSEAIASEVSKRLAIALGEGKWWYSIFESINTQAYASLEWWVKDWSSHKDWGEAVLKELNEILKNSSVTGGLIEQDRKEFGSEEVTQANYMRSHALQAMALFYRENFNLYLRDPYGNLLSHGWFPVEDNGEIVIFYKGKTYKEKAIFEGLTAISSDVKDLSKSLQELWEGLNLVNAWYADATTRLKPVHEKKYREMGVAEVQSVLGVPVWFTGHNPLNKLGVPFLVVDGRFAHASVDKGMAKRFGGEGAHVIYGAPGVTLRGFVTQDSSEIVDSPDTVIPGKKDAAPKVIRNSGMPSGQFLVSSKAALEEELVALDSSQGARRGADIGFMNASQHLHMNDFLDRLGARQAKYTKLTLSDESGFSKEIRVQAVPGMYQATGFRGHYAIRPDASGISYIYIDEDTYNQADGAKYAAHETDELMAKRKFAKDKNWTLDQLVVWLDSTGDAKEVEALISRIHNSATPLPKEAGAELVADLPPATTQRPARGAAAGGVNVNFADTRAVRAAISGIVEEIPGGGVKVLDESALRNNLVDRLAYDATFNPDATVVSYCRALIKDIAAAQGITLSSVYELYVQKAHDPRQYTIPAINIRGMGYNTSRAVFASAVNKKVDTFILEIAKSEIGYTGQRPAELTTSALAAAIKEGYKGKVYLQGDHFQIAAKDYSSNPEKAREDIKKLIREAILAGFYQIDLDMSVLVDWSKSAADEQQRTNYRETALMTAYVRALERELGLDKLGIVVNLGGEIGEIGMGLEAGKERNSSVEDLRAFMDGYRAELKRLGEEAGYELKPITKVAVQTGTKHGGVRDAQGQVTRAKVSFNTLAELGQAARKEYGLAGVVQHGASTLPEDYFTVFAGKPVPAGMSVDTTLLDETGQAALSGHPVAEVHLATAYQDTAMDHEAFPAALREQVRAFILEKFPVKTGQDPEGAFKENRKNAWGPFKAQVWGLPAAAQDAIRVSLQRQFDAVFNNLGVAEVRDTYIQALDARINSIFPEVEYSSFVTSLRGDAKGALVVDADMIFDNAGTIAALKKIKDAKTELRVVILADNESEVDRLRVMGAGEASDLISTGGVDDVLSTLEEEGIAAQRIMVFNSNDASLNNLAEERGVRVITVQIPDAARGNINAMPLIIARGVAVILRHEAPVVAKYQDLVQKYVVNNIISESDASIASDLVAQISAMPLAKVTEEKSRETSEVELAYQEVGGKI